MKKIFYIGAIASILFGCKTDLATPPPVDDGYQPPVTSELLISEVSVVTRADYPETGNSRNTYIELYNGTEADLDLTKYCMMYSHNGGGWGSRDGDTLFLTGTLPHSECYVITRDFGTGEANTTFPVEKRDVTWAITANGDDGIGLFKIDGSTYTLIDAYGEETRPSELWPLCGTDLGSVDVVVYRKHETADPNPDWNESSAGATCEWETTNLGNYSNVKLPTGQP